MDDLQARLDELRGKHGVPGAAVAVRHGDDETAWFSGSSSMDGGEPLDERSVFELGSVSKTYTATALMTLVADGTLALDEPVSTYLPELPVGERAVTLRHLLDHTSGLDGDHIVDTGSEDDAIQLYVATLGDVAQVTPVGDVFSYNNTAYVLAGRLLERATGMHWRAAVRRLLLEPLQLGDTYTSAVEVPEGQLATGHVQGEQGLSVAPASGIPRSLEPAGGICAGVLDVVRFAGVHLPDSHLLPQALRETMSSPSVPVADPSVGEAWGLGLSIARCRDPLVVGHDGGTVGHVASLRIVPEQRLAVAAVANSSAGGGALITELVAELLRELGGVVPRPPVEPLPDSRGSAWPIGTYVREGFRIDVTTDGPRAKVAIALNQLASAALGTSRLEGDLRATATPDVFVSNLFDPDEWTPVVLTERSGRRYVHLNGRAHALVSG